MLVIKSLTEQTNSYITAVSFVHVVHCVTAERGDTRSSDVTVGRKPRELHRRLMPPIGRSVVIINRVMLDSHVGGGLISRAKKLYIIKSDIKKH